MIKYELSIIIPAYNIDKYIAKCLDSIIIQDVFNNIEVVVINDGSTDETINICEKYASKYNNIKVYTKENGGVSSARNYGIKKSNGEYIMFIDGDDFIEKHYIDKMLFESKKSKSDLIVADYWVYISEKNKSKYRRKNINKSFTREQGLSCLLRGDYIGNNLFDKMFKKSKINEIKFNENIRIGEDLLFIYEYLKNIKTIKCISYPGYYYVQRAGSAMNSVFSDKQLDIIKVSELIKKDIEEEKYTFLEKNYVGFELHCKYKVLERLYKSNVPDNYINLKNELKEDIKKCNLRFAYKNMSRKRFYGSVLIKYFPKIYLLVCKFKKI